MRSVIGFRRSLGQEPSRNLLLGFLRLRVRLLLPHQVHSHLHVLGKGMTTKRFGRPSPVRCPDSMPSATSSFFGRTSTVTTRQTG